MPNSFCSPHGRTLRLTAILLVAVSICLVAEAAEDPLALLARLDKQETQELKHLNMASKSCAVASKVKVRSTDRDKVAEVSHTLMPRYIPVCSRLQIPYHPRTHVAAALSRLLINPDAPAPHQVQYTSFASGLTVSWDAKAKTYMMRLHNASASTAFRMPQSAITNTSHINPG